MRVLPGWCGPSQSGRLRSSLRSRVRSRSRLPCWRVAARRRARPQGLAPLPPVSPPAWCNHHSSLRSRSLRPRLGVAHTIDPFSRAGLPGPGAPSRAPGRRRTGRSGSPRPCRCGGRRSAPGRGAGRCGRPVRCGRRSPAPTGPGIALQSAPWPRGPRWTGTGGTAGPCRGRDPGPAGDRGLGIRRGGDLRAASGSLLLGP